MDPEEFEFDHVFKIASTFGQKFETGSKTVHQICLQNHQKKMLKTNLISLEQLGFACT